MPSPGVVGNPNWKPGVSGNPAGRPRTSVDSKKVRERVQESLATVADFVVEAEKEYKSSLELLIDFANDPKIQHSLRISAAAAAAPYEYAKKSSVPPPQYVETPIELPNFQSVEEAESFLLNLSKRVAAGELDFLSTEQVCSRVQNWINSVRHGQELELKRLASIDTGPQNITISGGLPTMPGLENVVMPRLNGNGRDLLEHEASPSPLAPQAGGPSAQVDRRGSSADLNVVSDREP
jgi:hypothetical protein